MLKAAEEKGPPAFSFRDVFRMVLDDTGLKASTVALELRRERSLMYKWLSGASIPPVAYVPQLVQVVAKRASRAKRMILVEHLRALVRGSSLPSRLRAALLELESPEEVLSECLDLSLGTTLAREPAGPPAALPTWPWLATGAAFATLFGGLAWNLLNRLLGWTYFMGSEGMGALPALAWGLITMAPVPAPFLLLGAREERARLALAATLFTLVGGACALAFYSSGIRGAIESRGLGYALQETIIAVIYGLVLSVPPQAAALLLLRRPSRRGRSIALVFIPTASALLGFLATLLVDRPESDVLQLRGFVVGVALRLSLYVVLAVAFLARPRLAASPET